MFQLMSAAKNRKAQFRACGTKCFKIWMGKIWWNQPKIQKIKMLYSFWQFPRKCIYKPANCVEGKQACPLPPPRPAKAAQKVLSGFASDKERVFDHLVTDQRIHNFPEKTVSERQIKVILNWRKFVRSLHGFIWTSEGFFKPLGYSFWWPLRGLFGPIVAKLYSWPLRGLLRVGGTIDRIMAGLRNFTFVANELQTIGSVMHVWSADGTKNEVERFNRRCHSVGKGNEVLNSAVAVISPLIKGNLWIINVAAKRRHEWVCGRILLATFNDVWNVRWRNRGG